MYRFPSNQGPVARLLSAVLVAAVFVVSLFLGAFIFLTVLGLAALLGLGLYLRFWWLRHRWWRERSRPSSESGRTLEGEYDVVTENEKPQDGRTDRRP